jgi:hypothetical protein
MANLLALWAELCSCSWLAALHKLPEDVWAMRNLHGQQWGWVASKSKVIAALTSGSMFCIVPVVAGASVQRERVVPV